MLGVMTAYAPKITFGKLRASGVRDVLVYCRVRKTGLKLFSYLRF